MDETEKLLFQDLLNSLQEIKEFLKCGRKETINDLVFHKVPVIAKKLGKNEGDTRELMQSPKFPSVPDEKGDLKVEEQAFIKWCRAEKVEIKEEE